MKNQIAVRLTSLMNDVKLPHRASLAVLASLLGAGSAFAASQTWTNAPADSTWTNVNNWIARALPGGLNMTGNTVNNDIATFNTPLAGGIGGEANPIITDDATIAGPPGPRCRQIGSIVFDGPNCGPYVIYNPNPVQVTDTNFPYTGVLFVSHNGGIFLTNGVANNQRIIVPLYTRLPSSTAGVYNFVNNSTNSATLYIASAVNNSANTRGTTWVLGGSNTGTNTVASLSAGTTTSGANGLTKQGAGTWILAGPNDFRAQTVVGITDGTLIVKDVNAFSLATNVTVGTTGTLQIDDVTLSQLYLNLNNGGTIQISGTNTINGVAVRAQTGTSGTLTTTSASDVITVGAGIATTTYVTGGAADSVLNTAGPGTFMLGVANTYLGKWSFGAATNQIGNASALSTGLNANVAAGAVLDLTPLGDTTFAPTTSGFGGSGTGTVLGSTAAAVLATAASTVDLTGKAVNLTLTPTAFSGDTAHPALYIAQGTLSLSGNTFFVNNASATPLGVGTYRLIQQASGSIASGGGYAALVSGTGLASGASAEIQVSAGNVDLVVSIYIAKDLVWSGGNPDTTWNVNSTANFLDGTTHSVFHNSDNVTFNSIGSTTPSVTLSGTLAPATVTVDTSANDYTFTGSGQIGGTTGLKKVSPGTLLLQTVNTYAGGTVVSNGVLRYGVNNAVSSTGGGDVAVYGGGVLDLNNLNGIINALNGDGAVDNQGGAASVLTVGNNDASGSFSGVLKNTSGTLAVTKIGTGTQALTASNAYVGATTISAGTLAAVNPYALGPSDDLTLTAGTLDVRTPRLYVNGLAGSGGTIANNSMATTNVLVIQGTNTTTFSGVVANGTGGGGMGLTVLGGALTMAGVNTYTGGTIVGSGASFFIPNSPAAVTGGVIASNGATLGLTGGSGTPGTPTSITTVEGATVTLTGGAEGKIWGGQFIGSTTSTNRFTGASTSSGPLSFSNFLGVVQLAMDTASNPNFRFSNANAGGDNTTFEFVSGAVHTDGGQTVRMGAIRGGSATCGINGPHVGGAIGTWLIGSLNTDSAFHGYITWSNNLVKVGSGSLTLDGIASYTNTVTLPDPNEATNIVSYTLSSNLITYISWTTVSNGVLKIVAPNSLTNSSGITLAGGTLDASEIGYAVNQTTLDYYGTEQPTNTTILVTSTVDLVGTQSLLGDGTIRGSLNAAAGTTVAPGVVAGATGTLTITNVATLNGAVNMDLNRSVLPTCDRMVAASFAGSGATLTVTNVGLTLVTGDTFQLFSGPVTAFSTVNLPVASADNSITYVWTNMLALNGSIKVLSGGSPVDTTPTNMTVVYSGGTLQFSWPANQTGWELQTNASGITQSNASYVYPGSTTTNQVTVTVDPAQPQVFYRLHLQYVP